MKILLAPSETKRAGGEASFKLNNLAFASVNSARQELLQEYLQIVQRCDLAELGKLFGLKKEADILKFAKDITKEPALKAILRYTGVAFDYIDYPSLDAKAQSYIDNNVILFSNLFGAIRADDLIPLYKLKQGEAIGALKPEKLYNSALKEPLDSYLESEDILDIRATYYNKFYKPNKFYTTLKFLKGGKVVSHWAKA
jgi:cytoplasmic iron level regulating protein YaaA (DUF328/UPF0246 family)